MPEFVQLTSCSLCPAEGHEVQNVEKPLSPTICHDGRRRGRVHHIADGMNIPWMCTLSQLGQNRRGSIGAGRRETRKKDYLVVAEQPHSDDGKQGTQESDLKVSTTTLNNTYLGCLRLRNDKAVTTPWRAPLQSVAVPVGVGHGSRQ